MEKNKYMVPAMTIVEIAGKETLLDASLASDSGQSTIITNAGAGDVTQAYSKEYDPWGLDDEE